MAKESQPPKTLSHGLGMTDGLAEWRQKENRKESSVKSRKPRP